MKHNIHIGISTCPNDTFAFHGLLNNLVDTRNIVFQFELLDIQQLNNGLFEGRFDVAKASFSAAVLLADQMWVLPSGSALGFGVGPLLLARRHSTEPRHDQQLTLCPGEHTTAALLYRLYYPNTARVEHVGFHEIMPKLQRAEADFGVCIHEGRFTWQDQGLALVEDLGSRWEAETACPLPLGGLLARRTLAPEVITRVQAAIRDSILLAQARPESALPTMRRYAQEFDDHVLMQHVDLYVNDWTVDLGTVGAKALNTLCNLSAASPEESRHSNRLEIFP